jgi:hypothetical protein
VATITPLLSEAGCGSVRIWFAESLPRCLLTHPKNTADLLPSDPVFARCRDEGGDSLVDSLRLALKPLALLKGFANSREDVVLLGQDAELLLKIRHESSIYTVSRPPDETSHGLTDRQEALTSS